MSGFLALRLVNYWSMTNLVLGDPQPPQLKKTQKNLGIVHSDFVPLGESVNQVFYLGISRYLRNSVRQKCPDMRERGNDSSITTMPQQTLPCQCNNFFIKNGMTPLLHLLYSQDLAPCDFFLFTHMKSLERKSFYECWRSFKSDIARNEEWFWSAWGKNSQHASRSLADDTGRQTDLGGVPHGAAGGGCWYYECPASWNSFRLFLSTHSYFFYCWNFGYMSQYLAWCKSIPFCVIHIFRYFFFLEWWSDCDVAYFDDLMFVMHT